MSEISFSGVPLEFDYDDVIPKVYFIRMRYLQTYHRGYYVRKWNRKGRVRLNFRG